MPEVKALCPCCGNRKACDCYSQQSTQNREITALKAQLADIRQANVYARDECNQMEARAVRAERQLTKARAGLELAGNDERLRSSGQDDYVLQQIRAALQPTTPDMPHIANPALVMVTACWICGKEKGQPPGRCPGHYEVSQPGGPSKSSRGSL